MGASWERGGRHPTVYGNRPVEEAADTLLSTISELHDTGAALAEATAALRAELGPDRPDLVLVFVSPHHSAGFSAALFRRFS